MGGIGLNNMEQSQYFPEISLRNYFAAHAPDVPEYFQSNLPPEPMPLDIHDQFYEPDQQDWLGYFSPEGETQEDQWAEAPGVPQAFKDEVTNFLKKHDKRYREICEWRDQELIQRIIQWRFYYADQMVAGSLK